MDDDLGDDELASADTTVRGSYLAAVMRPVLAAAEIFGDGTGELSSSGAEPEASAAESPAPAAGDGQETVNSQNEPEAGEDQVTAGGQDDTFTDQETPPNVQEPSENPGDDSGVIVDFGSGNPERLQRRLRLRYSRSLLLPAKIRARISQEIL